MNDPLKTPLAAAWPAVPTGWTEDDTEKFLTQQPLPGDFLWPHRDRNDDGSEKLAPVLPSYRIHKGYGFWLRTTPYFPGLFEQIHAILLRWPDLDPLPDAAALGELLTARRKAAWQQQSLPIHP